MDIKYNPQSVLVYCTLLFYFLALCLYICKQKKTAHHIYWFGFCVALVSYSIRWVFKASIPLQNLYDVFLSLGVLVYPVSLFSKKLLKIDCEWPDVLCGILFLVPVGFVFSQRANPLPPALQSPFFIPHVLSYVIGYVFMFKASIQAALLVCTDFSGKEKADVKEIDLGIYKLVCVGLPFLTIGLILGSIWGQFAWGSFWNWDPKEMWSLATFLTFVFYLQFKNNYKEKYFKLSAWIIMFGLALILITLLWANLSRLFAGLHSYS